MQKVLRGLVDHNNKNNYLVFFQFEIGSNVKGII